MPPNWQRDDAGGIFAVCDDDELDLARLTSAPVMKENTPMTQHDDTFVDELSDLLGRMSASDSRTLRKFLEAVDTSLTEVKKDASSDFLAQLRAYLASYLSELAAIPGDGNQTDVTGAPRTPQFPASGKPTRPQASALSPALKALAERLVKGMVAKRVAGCIVAEQDTRGLVATPLRDAVEAARQRGDGPTPVTKHDTPATEVDQLGVEEEFGWLAQKGKR
ncbi:MAG: hypothetical protein MUP14_02375 [Dehalococcoidia bacterium]|nr:hypothetical protein [Dehalococcoidia bacterium]